MVFDIYKIENKRSKLLIYNRRNAFNLPFQNRIEHKKASSRNKNLP